MQAEASLEARFTRLATALGARVEVLDRVGTGAPALEAQLAEWAGTVSTSFEAMLAKLGVEYEERGDRVDAQVAEIHQRLVVVETWEAGFGHDAQAPQFVPQPGHFPLSLLTLPPVNPSPAGAGC